VSYSGQLQVEQLTEPATIRAADAKRSKTPETTSATDMEVDTDTPLRAKHSIPKHHSDDIVYEAYGFSDDHKQ
jgi:hypothetical protein